VRDHAAADAAVERARAWIAANVLIRDTETTGRDGDVTAGCKLIRAAD